MEGKERKQPTWLSSVMSYPEDEPRLFPTRHDDHLAWEEFFTKVKLLIKVQLNVPQG
jgi:hypothetical protein